MTPESKATWVRVRKISGRVRLGRDSLKPRYAAINKYWPIAHGPIIEGAQAWFESRAAWSASNAGHSINLNGADLEDIRATGTIENAFREGIGKVKGPDLARRLRSDLLEYANLTGHSRDALLQYGTALISGPLRAAWGLTDGSVENLSRMVRSKF